jgi:hypothetical protein
MLARGEDGEGGADDSGDVPGLEVGLYSAVQSITGLTRASAPFTITQDGETLNGIINKAPASGDTYSFWFVSCDGPAQGRGPDPTPNDRYSAGMYPVIKADALARGDCIGLFHIDDHGYVDGGQVDDTGTDGTGRFTGPPESLNSEYAYLQSYAAYLGIMGMTEAEGDTLADRGFMQVRFSNEERQWCDHYLASYDQSGDHTYLGDQGEAVKPIATYINARKAWDHAIGLTCPDYLDQSSPDDYVSSDGTAWVFTIGDVQFIAPDRDWNAGGPAAADISSIVTGAVTTINSASDSYFKVDGQAAILSGVSGSPDINGEYIVDSIPGSDQIVIQLDSQGGGPYSGGTVKGKPLRTPVPDGGSWSANSDTEQYLSNAQIDSILAAVEASSAKWRIVAGSVDMFYQAPVAVMDAADVAFDNDPLDNIRGSRYGSQQPLGGYHPAEMKRLMTQDDSGGNAAQGIMGKMERLGSQGCWLCGDHHHSGCKVHYRPPADSTSDWMRLVQLWSGSVNQSTAAHNIHPDCLTKWRSFEGTTLYWLPPVDTRTPRERIATSLPDDIRRPISAIRAIVNGADSIEFTIFNERSEVLFETTMYAGQGNIPNDLGFFKGKVMQEQELL